MKKILVVDDNVSVRRFIRSLLEEDADLRVCGEASDGVEAIEVALLLQPDLIVLDYVMPEMNAEAASILKRRLPKDPIISFTLHADAVSQEMKETFQIDMVLGKADNIGSLVPSKYQATCIQDNQLSVTTSRVTLFLTC